MTPRQRLSDRISCRASLRLSPSRIASAAQRYQLHSLWIARKAEPHPANRRLPSAKRSQGTPLVAGQESPTTKARSPIWPNGFDGP
jgi:hypothetical protein